MKPTHKEVERRRQIHESSGHEAHEIMLINSNYVAYLCSCRALIYAEDEFYEDPSGDNNGFVEGICVACNGIGTTLGAMPDREDPVCFICNGTGKVGRT